MRGDYPDDTFTEVDILNALSGAGLRYKVGSRYILSQCPSHEDKNPSVQIYKDDWFVNCHAGCGRFHITKAFPELRPQHSGSRNTGLGVQTSSKKQRNSQEQQVTERTYETYNLMEQWEKMPMIPRDHEFKGIPIDHLDYMGWRWDESKNAYFIPYFSRSRTSIPFAQWRYLDGDVRFRFLKDAKPTMYGTWNLLPDETYFLVEGTSDAIVLDLCGIPWIAAPSSASGALVKALAGWCKENNVKLVYAGDNDLAGDKLREALDEIMPYRVYQPPKKYKDWGDFFVAEGAEAVSNYCYRELNPGFFVEDTTDVEKITSVFPGAIELEVVGSKVSKEQTSEPTPLPF